MGDGMGLWVVGVCGMGYDRAGGDLGCSMFTLKLGPRFRVYSSIQARSDSGPMRLSLGAKVRNLLMALKVGTARLTKPRFSTFDTNIS